MARATQLLLIWMEHTLWTAICVAAHAIVSHIRRCERGQHSVPTNGIFLLLYIPICMFIRMPRKLSSSTETEYHNKVMYESQDSVLVVVGCQRATTYSYAMALFGSHEQTPDGSSHDAVEIMHQMTPLINTYVVHSITLFVCSLHRLIFERSRRKLCAARDDDRHSATNKTNKYTTQLGHCAMNAVDLPKRKTIFLVTFCWTQIKWTKCRPLGYCVSEKLKRTLSTCPRWINWTRELLWYSFSFICCGGCGVTYI